MKKKIILSLSLLLMSACATMQIETVTKSGTSCKASASAAFMNSEAMQATACKGSMSATGTTVDPVAGVLIDAMLKAIATPK